MCAFKHAPITGWFLASTCFFFILPMIFISVLYSLIAVAIHRSTIEAPKIHRSSSDTSKASKEHGACIRDGRRRSDGNIQARARRSVLKMLGNIIFRFVHHSISCFSLLQLVYPFPIGLFVLFFVCPSISSTSPIVLNSLSISFFPMTLFVHVLPIFHFTKDK